MYRIPVLLCFLGLFAVACSDEGEAPFEGDGKVVTKGSPRSMATANGEIYFANEVDGDPVISRLNTADGTVTQVVGPLDAKVSQVVTDGGWPGSRARRLQLVQCATCNFQMGLPKM